MEKRGVKVTVMGAPPYVDIWSLVAAVLPEAGEILQLYRFPRTVWGFGMELHMRITQEELENIPEMIVISTGPELDVEVEVVLPKLHNGG
ncbi:hypothetical protein Ahia01_000419700 [Argonauta hians]